MTDHTFTPAQSAKVSELVRELVRLSPIGSFHTTPHWEKREALMGQLRDALAAQPPAAPVETEEIRQLRAAVEYWRLAAERREERRDRTGLDIPEAQTLDAPDLPHSSAATGQADVLAHLRVTFRQHGIDAALEDAAEEIARLRAVPQGTREQIAEIIDPMAFKTVPGSEAQSRALHKADRILALSRPMCGRDEEPGK